MARPPKPKFTTAILKLLAGGAKTPEQMTTAINLSPDFTALRDHWGGKVKVDQVYAAMSGLRSKREGMSKIEPVDRGEPSSRKPYQITRRGRDYLGELIRVPDEETTLTEEPSKPDVEHVDHPAHYGGGDNPYEAIKVIEAWDLDFCLGNTVKYISRAGKKDKAKEVEDLRKAAWYLNRRIVQLDGEPGHE